MKKILGLIKNICLVIVLLAVVGVFIGGGSDDKSSSKSEKESTEQSASNEKKEKKKAKEEAKEEVAEQEEVAEEPEESNDGPSIATDSKYSVTIDGTRIVEDYDGAPCIAVDYTFTNVSDDSPTSMQLATDITVYQSGVECEDAFFADANSDGFTNKIKSGVSVNVTRAYKLQNLTDDVEIEVAPLFSWNDDLLAYAVYQLG